MKAQLISALTVLHNIIGIFDLTDLPKDDDFQDRAQGNNNNIPIDPDIEADDTAPDFRDEITLRMWQDYTNGNYHHA